MKTIFPEVAQRAHRTSLRAARTAIALSWGLALSSALAQAPAATVTDAPGANATVAPAAAAAPAPTEPAAARDPASSLEWFGWLHGCWAGKVNQRDFREDWLPARGDMMVGVSQTVVQGKTQDFEYLRLEVRPDGIFYIAVPSGKNETAFRFAGKTLDGANELFTFENSVDEFPQRIVYRHATEGWLYAQVEGKINGSPRSAIYPMRNIDCMSGEVIRH
jgi:Domain of unknown function (DUF6265)